MLLKDKGDHRLVKPSLYYHLLRNCTAPKYFLMLCYALPPAPSVLLLCSLDTALEPALHLSRTEMAFADPKLGMHTTSSMEVKV